MDQAVKRLCVVTGSRAEYGALRPFLRLASESSVFELQLVVAGQHLLPEYGYTYREIEADGFIIDRTLAMDGSPYRVLSQGTYGFGKTFCIDKPDMVLVEGDRIEALAATLAAAYSGIPIAHGGGGDVTSTIDNSARHAISHFASLHFVSTEQAAERLRAMDVGGDIYVTGALAIDAILAHQFASREDTLADLGLPPGSRYLLVAFHPESGQEDRAGEWMANVLDACHETGLTVVATYPNSDPGSAKIIAEIEIATIMDGNVAPRHVTRAFPSLGSDRYLNALRHADALVGNSSSGLYEAPSLKVPVVNVGHRQDGRKVALNVTHAGYGYESIKNTIEYALSAYFREKVLPFTTNPYGSGHAAERMMEIIERRLGK